MGHSQKRMQLSSQLTLPFQCSCLPFGARALGTWLLHLGASHLGAGRNSFLGLRNSRAPSEDGKGITPPWRLLRLT